MSFLGDSGHAHGARDLARRFDELLPLRRFQACQSLSIVDNMSVWS